MINYIDNPIFGVGLTIIIFSICKYINKKFKLSILNPIALSIIWIILILKNNNINYNVYNKGGYIINFFLAPATVALALPLYKKIKLLKENFMPIIIGIFVGSLAGIITIIILGYIFNLDRTMILSLIPKSTTTAISIDISKEIGGSPAITIAFVIITGIIGNIISPKVLNICRVNNKVAKGIAIGTSSHVIGTNKAIELGETEGAMSSLAVSIAGLITVFLAPIIIKWIKIL